ncbi:methyltransferase domain-containing protein [Pelagibius sp. 7325]|uniref:class I SAM-dependent methyltransferase n=1 Tax=Pelagibius sp. 7325 TaxID=3131994 RepID=UPI0030EB6CBC
MIADVAHGQVAIDFASEDEIALARPFVLHDEGRYKMWFAHKGSAYTLGHAESEDGVHWQRDDSFAGLALSPGTWDGDMVEYAAVASHDGRYFMFADRGAQLYGVEINDEMVAVASERAKELGMAVEIAAGHNRALPFPDGSDHFRGCLADVFGTVEIAEISENYPRLNLGFYVAKCCKA